MGATCPPSCPFLSGKLPDGSEIPPKYRCYAGSMQGFRKSVALGWARTTDATRDPDCASRLTEELQKEELVRIHVGGDFLKEDGLVDGAWILNFTFGVEKARQLGWTGKIWLYTHAWKQLKQILPGLPWMWQELGVACYASCHTPEEVKDALEQGWLIAYDMGDAKPASGFHEVAGIRVLGCPEQVKGWKAVTCDKCKWCPHGKGHVGFFRH